MAFTAEQVKELKINVAATIFAAYVGRYGQPGDLEGAYDQAVIAATEIVDRINT